MEINTQAKVKATWIEEKSAEQKIVLKDVLEMLNISEAKWLEILFEAGCKYIESKNYPKDLESILLQNRDKGYWDWFLSEFVADNKSMIKVFRNSGVERISMLLFMDYVNAIIGGDEIVDNSFKNYLKRISK